LRCPYDRFPPAVLLQDSSRHSASSLSLWKRSEAGQDACDLLAAFGQHEGDSPHSGGLAGLSVDYFSDAAVHVGTPSQGTEGRFGANEKGRAVSRYHGTGVASVRSSAEAE